MTTLCTLFNSLYLDKGLVLYDSLRENAKGFVLYVLCMDDLCFDVLLSINEEQLKPIRLKDIENEFMLEAKSNRTAAEYCWTCSSRLVQYIIEAYRPDCCTYIDADMYFYHDPRVLIDEVLRAGKSVMMVPHRFTKNNISLADKVGTYCVEFNTFKNDSEALTVLNHWHSRCLECCSNLGDGVHWGDQKYLDEWPILFPDCVHVCTHPGAGVAPWNIEWYKGSEGGNTVVYKMDGCLYPIIFYHFQSISFLSKCVVDIEIADQRSGIDYGLIDSLYKVYLSKIYKKKEWLKTRYGLETRIRIHPSAKKNLKTMILSSPFLKKVIRDLWPRRFPRPHYIYLDCDGR